MRLFKKLLLYAGGLFLLLVVIGYASFGMPSLWAKTFPVKPEMNAHLAESSVATAEEAAWEAINWDVAVRDRTPKSRLWSLVDGETFAEQVVQIIEPPLDDSYHSIYYEVTLKKTGDTWAVTKLKRCWRGRGLFGWSTGIPL